MVNFSKLSDWVDMDKINWSTLSKNPNAIHLLEQNQDKIDWYALSSNPNAIRLLEQHQDKINWLGISYNPNAIHLLEQNQDKINWRGIYNNPNIFTYDYAKIEKFNAVEIQCVNEYVNHPKMVRQFLYTHDVDDIDNRDVYMDWFNNERNLV